MSSANVSSGFSGLWVIMKESGMPLTTVQPMTSNEKDPMLFAGLMVAIRNMMSSLQIGQLTSFSTDTHIIRVKTSKDLISVIATEKTTDSSIWDSVLVEIHKRVENAYKQSKNVGPVNADEFDSLTSEVSKILLQLQTDKQQVAKQEDELEHNDTKARNRLEETGLW